MKEPVDHILRPRLPWRDDAPITECGYAAEKVETITREQFAARLIDYGTRRTAMVTCMTCSDTARRHGSWDDDPRQAIAREVEWETSGRRRNENGIRLRDELLAIADLIASHSAEFADMVAAIGKRREWVERKKVLETRPRVIKGGSSL